MGLCDEASLLQPLLGGTSGYRRDRRRNNNNNEVEIELDKKGFQRFSDSDDMSKATTKSSSGLTVLFRKVSLLVWKNFLFRKRHYIVSIFEILLPTLFACLLAFAKAKVPAELNQLKEGQPIKNVTIFPELDDTSLLELLQLEIGRKSVIAYSPNNTLVQDIIKKIGGIPQTNNIEWLPFNSEVEIETYNGQLGTTNNSLKAAIVFDAGFQNSTFPAVGQNLAYKIRFSHDLQHTSELFPIFQIPGPNIGNSRAYASAGFSGLQILIDKAIIEIITKEPLKEKVSLQAFPYPPYILNFDFIQIFNILLPMLLTLSFIFIVPSIVRGVVGEKETGIRELLKMMGLPSWMQWLGWMINSLLVSSISITLVVFLLFYPFNGVNGGLIEHSDPTVWGFVLLLYVISSTAFCFFISSFFQRPTLATTFGIVIWMVSYFVPAQATETKYQNMSLMDKLSLSLIPNMALRNAIRIMSGFEGKAVGSRWSNFFEPMSSIDSLTLAHVSLMMIVSTTLYISGTLYVENVFPSQYGVRKKWYYIFKLSTWYSPKVSNSTSISRLQTSERQPGFEADPPGLTPGVEIYNLRKKFNHKVAVDDVTLKMFDGQITALLGYNGCGKTTTMSMLTGMFAPTSGSAVVNGHDISTDLEGVRRNLGLCPQHNMLFDKLTVAEHLEFFGRLKGMTSAEAKSEMKEILRKLHLSDKLNVLSMALSGGQKRKLNLGISLIGGSKVIILDEPTSGMDPEARRAIWDLLLEMRGQRTILLTTHFMEEADVLGDRIAIMADGKIKCCGTPMFLKRFYGTGYTLSMTMEPKSRPDMVLLTVKNYIEHASFKKQHAPNSSEIAITLPVGNSTTVKFPDMFAELSQNKEELGIKTIGLSLTTMDEVFVKVGELSHGEEQNGDTNHEVNEFTPETQERKTPRSDSDFYVNRLRGLALASQQFYALLLKRYLYTLRKRRLFVCQLIIPVALLIVAILVTNGQYTPPVLSPPLTMSLRSYKNAITLYSSTDQKMGDSYKTVVGLSAVNANYDNGTLGDNLVAIGDNDLAMYRERYIVAAEMNSSHVKAMFSTIPDHASPLALNLASNTLLTKLASTKGYSIEVTNYPLPAGGIGSILDAASSNPVFSKTIPILFAIFLPLGLALLAASYVVFPVEERLCKAKQLQLMTGVNPLIFWGSSFVWDFFVMILLICVMICCFPIFQVHGVFTAYNGAGVLFLILMTYGFAAISFSYLCSLMMSTVAGGFSFVTIIHVFSGMVMCIVVYVLELSGLFDESNYIRSIARIMPTFGAAISTMQFTEKAALNSRCSILSDESKEVLCDPTRTIPEEYRQCCDNCDALRAPCFKPTPYLVWSEVKHSEMNHNSVEVPGIGQELFYLLLLGIAFKLVLIIVEFGIVKRLLAKIFQTGSSVFQQGAVDDDVGVEASRVQDLLITDRLVEDAIVVNNLCKSFGSFAAVANINFAVHHGECFGLLGVNGAGKTTTFRMLTGDEIRSFGNAYTSMCSLQNDRKQFLSSIGYCPQFDGIVGVLTGKEMLELFCRLRGVQKHSIHSEATKWLVKLGLGESANVQCQKYSGGMKRRLSAAMALIGDPPVVLLDEPTSGVDPVARRQFWKVISAVRDSGQAVILTSHSMEECEALCTRLAIMVNGRLQCLGGVQHLKNKFAQGYSLTIKLKSMLSEDSSEVYELTNIINDKFKPCILKDHHQNMLHYQILNMTMPWDILFKIMENLKESHVHVIEDYSVSETTLEDVFLSFARKQYPNRQADVPFLRKLITCQCCQ